MPTEAPVRAVDWLLFLPPIILGAGYALQQAGRSAFKAAWLGLPYGFALTEGALRGSEYELVILGEVIVIGIILATVGAVFAILLRALSRRLRRSQV